MARTREEIISEMVDSGLFNDQEIKDAASKAGGDAKTPDALKFTQGFVKTYEGEPKTLLQKADVAAGKAANAAFKPVKLGLDLANAPFELAGEALRVPIEQKDGFRAPSIIQDIMPSTQTAEPPMNPFSLVNKLLRAGAGALSNPTSPLEGARSAYNAPRGAMGPVEDTAMGLLLGKVVPEVAAAPADAAVAGIAKTGEVAKDIASTITKKAVRAALGPTEEAQSVLFNRPNDVARQTDFNDLGTRLADTVHGLQDKVSELDGQAWDTLLKLKAEPQSKLLSLLKGVKNDFIGTGKTKIGDSDRAAAEQIQSYIDRIKAIKQPGATPGTEQMLDQPQIKNIIQSIQKDATYGLVKNEPVNRAVKAARSAIDGYLKGENPSYEDAMKPVAEATSALEQTVKNFRLERDMNGNLVPSKATLTNLKNAAASKSPTIDRTLEQLKNVTGIDFADEANLTNIKQEFTPGVARANGSRRAKIGAGVGAGVGALISKLLGIHPVVGAAAGGALGDMAGGSMDYYGGSTAKSLIDMLSKGKTGVGNVLAAINAKTEGTPLQDIVKRILEGQPAVSPILRGNQ
jgi:hypothetical protein